VNNFKNLGIEHKLIESISELGFENPTPVQEKAIPLVLNDRSDLIALAQTGTGKTAAFGLPSIQQIDLKNYSLSKFRVQMSTIILVIKDIYTKKSMT